MALIGAKIRWKNGNILHPAIMWKSPSKRRLPRLLVEDRAKEVGIKIQIQEPWIIFEETNLESEQIPLDEAVQLEFYLNRYYLLPSKYYRQDTFEWLKKDGNSLLLWGVGNKYFVRKFE